jgi:hypothetical protein
MGSEDVTSSASITLLSQLVDRVSASAPCRSLLLLTRVLPTQRAEAEIRKAGSKLIRTVDSLAQLGSAGSLARPTDSTALARDWFDVQRCRDTLVSVAAGLLCTLKQRAARGGVSGHLAAAVVVVIGSHGARSEETRQAELTREALLRRNLNNPSTDISSRSGSWISCAPSVLSDNF